MHDPQTEPALRRAETARRNGAQSRGPVTPEGKARSAMNAARHGLCGRTMPEGADGAEIAALRAALLTRWQPADAAEAHQVEELVFAAWRQMRLRAVEDAVLTRAGCGEEPGRGLPSLATVLRYRARVERDVRLATGGCWSCAAADRGSPSRWACAGSPSASSGRRNWPLRSRRRGCLRAIPARTNRPKPKPPHRSPPPAPANRPAPMVRTNSRRA